MRQFIILNIFYKLGFLKAQKPKILLLQFNCLDAMLQYTQILTRFQQTTHKIVFSALIYTLVIPIYFH